MTSFYDNYDYYKKMLQLQEKLRKSEEERIRLEERFKTLMQESRNRHYTCISRLRLRYIEFLEEQRSKDDRSHKLLETLNNVDNSLELMTAKINRLNILKEQYENYRGTYATHSLPESIVHTVADVENINPKRNITARYLPSKVKSRSPSRVASPASNLNNEIKTKHYTHGLKLINQPINDNQSKPSQEGIQSAQHLPYKVPYYRIIPLNSLSDQNVPYTSKFSTKRMDTAQITPKIVVSGCTDTEIPQGKPLDAPQDQTKPEFPQNYIKPRVVVRSYQPEKSKMLLHDTRLRLSKYIPKPIIIKQNAPNTSSLNTSSPLKRDFQSYLDYSLKEPDVLQQSSMTSGHLECFTSKDLNRDIENELDKYIDKIHKLHRDNSAQSLREIEEEDANGSARKVSFLESQSIKNFSKDIEQVLATAGDLASRSANLNNIDDPNKISKNENKSRTTHDSIPVLEENRAVYSNIDEGHETSVEATEDKISTDITLYEPKLDSHEDTEKLEKRNFDSTNDLELQGDKNATSSNDKFREQITENLKHEEHFKEYGINVSKETEVDQYSFDTVEELEPWNLNSVQKQIKNIQLIEETEDEFDKDNQVKETDGTKITESQMEEQDFKEIPNAEETDLGNTNDRLNLETSNYPELKESTVDNCETEINEMSDSSQKKSEYVDDYINSENIENPESGHYKLVEQEEYENIQKEECYEVNQIPDVNQDNTQEIIMQDSEYNNQNCFEESNQVDYTHNTEADQFNLGEEYSYNQNMSYENNQEYDQNVFVDNNQQQEYKEYVQESNEQDNSENQYEQDFNTQYTENLDQQYACYQETNPNQLVESNVDQPTEYVEISDFNQPEITQKNEDQQSSEYKQLQEQTNNQEVEETSENYNVSENQSMKQSTENETNQEKDVKRSLLDSDTDSTIERNVTNTESDFDFN